MKKLFKNSFCKAISSQSFAKKSSMLRLLFILALISLTSGFCGHKSLSFLLAKTANWSQQQCQNLILRGPKQALRSALICGSDLGSSDSKDLLQRTHLYHGLVVSQSHLWTYLWILGFLFRLGGRLSRFQSLLQHLLLILILFFTGFQPPVALAYFLFLQRMTKPLSLLHAPAQVLLTLYLCLCLQPQWIHSFSLQLSLICSVVLFLIQELQIQNSWGRASLFYLALLMPLSPFSGSHPLALIMNVILAPVLCGLALPLAWLAQLGGFAGIFLSLFEKFWDGFEFILRQAAELVPVNAGNQPRWLWLTWLFSFSLWLSLHLLYMYRRRYRVLE